MAALPKDGLVEIEVVAKIGVLTAGSIYDRQDEMKHQLWKKWLFLVFYEIFRLFQMWFCTNKVLLTNESIIHMIELIERLREFMCTPILKQK